MIAHTPSFLSISSLTQSPYPHPSPVHASREAARLKGPILGASKPIEKSEPQGRTLEKAPGGGGGVRQWGGGTVHVCCKH